MKNQLALTTALFIALGLSGCSGAEPTVTPGSEAPGAEETIGDEAVETLAEEPTADTPVTEEPAPTMEESTEEAPENRSAAFGDTVTFEGGVDVTVESLGFRPASEFAAGAVEGQIAAFQITVVNNGQEEVEAGLMGAPTVRYGEQGQTAEGAFDETIGNEYLSTILPGDTQTVTVGFGIPAADAGKIQVEITDPSFTGKDAIFQGAIQ